MQTLHVLAMVAGAPSLYIVWHTDLHIHVGYSVSPSPNDADIYPHFLFFPFFFFCYCQKTIERQDHKGHKGFKAELYSCDCINDCQTAFLERRVTSFNVTA